MKQRMPVFAHKIAACRLQNLGMDTYTTHRKIDA